ncbi:ganglioside-induced differentiation-associated protein 1-like [Diadema antillarum]|uniref:ganglioside-induced differentiation-associated protein 1-like n=1 Tax=Diadema antillarum TaxID=105358 RepID=UPI003A842E9E
MESPVPLLYHSWISGFSQRVRLAFAEKGLEYREQVLNIVHGDQHDPHYLRVVNPNGTVPTLEHGGKYIRDSKDIIDYIDKLPSEKPNLIPDEGSELRIQVDHMLDLIDTFDMPRVSRLALATPQLAKDPVLSADDRKKLFEGVGSKRTEKLKRVKAENPDISEIVQVIIDKSPPPSSATTREAALLTQLDVCDKGFAEIETALEKQKESSGGQQYWLCADHITLPDIHLGVLLHRLVFVGQAKRLFLVKQPLLTNYYQRFIARQSFRSQCSVVNDPSQWA